MANGRVCTGFSKPYVATYTESGGTITYGTPTVLARGVDVTISPEAGSDDDFYADNQQAESAGGVFSSGTFSLTVDGLKDAAKKLIMGLPTADSSGWMAYGDSQEIPYVGLGFIARYMEDGVTTYVPYLIAKCKFDLIENAAATSEESVNFQTQALSGKIYRGDDANHTWRYEGSECQTEAAAITALTTKLGA